jgi:hypothetical protein
MGNHPSRRQGFGGLSTFLSTFAVKAVRCAIIRNNWILKNSVPAIRQFLPPSFNRRTGGRGNAEDKFPTIPALYKYNRELARPMH